MIKIFNAFFERRIGSKKNNGLSLLEVVVSIAIFSIIVLIITSFIIWMNFSNSRTKADRDTLENARKVLDIMTYEIRGAKGIYTPTTTSNQLSLETAKYLPTDEVSTYIDFFLCGSSICLKKESQNPAYLTSDNVQVASLVFSQFSNNGRPSIQINLTLNYKNPDNNPSSTSLVTLTSTASLRSY